MLGRPAPDQAASAASAVGTPPRTALTRRCRVRQCGEREEEECSFELLVSSLRGLFADRRPGTAGCRGETCPGGEVSGGVEMVPSPTSMRIVAPVLMLTPGINGDR